MNERKNICILGGGWSNERLISLKSAHDVYNSLTQNGHDTFMYDMKTDSFDDLKKFILENHIHTVLNLIHGEGGEDGKVQKYLESLDVHYCGSNSHASELSFNKYLSKLEWVKNGLSTPEFIIYKDQEYNDLVTIFGTQFFIKDTCSGSSNNIYLIRNNKDFDKFTEHKDSREYMIERKIIADEYTAAILNNQVLPIIKIVPANDFYDFEAKYKSDKTEFLFPELDQDILKQINKQVLKAFSVLGCERWARVDFFMSDNKIELLEINTIPGMTDHSLVPKAAKKYGLSYYQLILEILGINA